MVKQRELATYERADVAFDQKQNDLERASQEAALAEAKIIAENLKKRGEAKQVVDGPTNRRERYQDKRMQHTKADTRFRPGSYNRIESPLDIGFIKKRPGYELGWMVYKIHDAPYENNIMSARLKGWNYADPADYPELMMDESLFDTDNSRARKHITCQGQVLMEIPTELYEQLMEYNNRKTNEQMENTRRFNDGLMDNGGILRPLSGRNGVITSFGRGNYFDDPNFKG